MDRLWPDTTVEENNLTITISALRKALNDSPEQHKYIVTIPGEGYRFAAEVAVSEHPTPIEAVGGTPVETPTISQTVNPARHSRLRILGSSGHASHGSVVSLH